MKRTVEWSMIETYLMKETTDRKNQLEIRVDQPTVLCTEDELSS